jgi:hypothetical protein
MTIRERFLLRVLGLTFVLLTVLGLVSFYLDGLVRMDDEYASLQKQALRIQSQMMDQRAPEVRSLGFDPGARFWTKGLLPDPTVLATRLQPLLERQSVRIIGLQVLESTAKAQTLQYTLEAPMDRFMKAFAEARTGDSHLIVKRLVTVLKDKGIYGITWEVGYATTP